MSTLEQNIPRYSFIPTVCATIKVEQLVALMFSKQLDVPNTPTAQTITKDPVEQLGTRCEGLFLQHPKFSKSPEKKKKQQQKQPESLHHKTTSLQLLLSTASKKIMEKEIFFGDSWLEFQRNFSQ